MENKVVLDFSKCDYSDAAPYDEQSLIHRSKMRQIMRMWDQLYDNAIEVGENTDFHRFHSTISVFASRGAGKFSGKEIGGGALFQRGPAPHPSSP